MHATLDVPAKPQRVNGTLLAHFEVLRKRLLGLPRCAQVDLTPERHLECRSPASIPPRVRNVFPLAKDLWAEFFAEIECVTRIGVYSRNADVVGGERRHPLFLQDNEDSALCEAVVPIWKGDRPPMSAVAYSIVAINDGVALDMGTHYGFLDHAGRPGKLTSVAHTRGMPDLSRGFLPPLPEAGLMPYGILTDIGTMAEDYLDYYFSALATRLESGSLNFQIPMKIPRTIPTAAEMGKPTALVDILHPDRFFRSRRRLIDLQAVVHDNPETSGEPQLNDADEGSLFYALREVDAIEIATDERRELSELDEEANFTQLFVNFRSEPSSACIYAFAEFALKHIPQLSMDFDLGKLRPCEMIYISFGRQNKWEVKPGYFVDGVYMSCENDEIGMYFTTICPTVDYSHDLNILAFPEIIWADFLEGGKQHPLGGAMEKSLQRAVKANPEYPKSIVAEMITLAISLFFYASKHIGDSWLGFPGLGSVAPESPSQLEEIKKSGFHLASIFD